MTMETMDAPAVSLPVRRRASALETMASRFDLDPSKLMAILRNTVIKPSKGREASDAEVAAFVVVANQYELNPFTKEIHAFESNGAIVPIVGVDGWARIVNRQDRFDGCDFQEAIGDGGKPISTTCTMYVQGRSHPIRVTEWYDECKRNSAPWTTMPKRMLRHKAFMQASRLAFGLSGIYDEDEGRDILRNSHHVVVEPPNGSKGAALADRLSNPPTATTEAAPASVEAEQDAAAEAPQTVAGANGSDIDPRAIRFDELVQMQSEKHGVTLDEARSRLVGFIKAIWKADPANLTDDQFRDLAKKVGAGEISMAAGKPKK